MENAAFEKAAASSLKTLEGLNKTINGLDGSKAFSGLQAAANSVNLSSIADSVSTIADRFSNLGIIATTALANIANKAVDLGITLAKSLTIDPLVQGFEEYELKMDSIKVTLNNTGRPLEDVKAALEDLNKYADDTIYSFSDMTTAMGLFTTQGIGLEDASAAIKGVSNLAAITGANSEQASRAMFNFAQALATGKMMLVDWKTMENTGMGNSRFKEELIETAEALGYFNDEMQFNYGNNQSISGSQLAAALKDGDEAFRETLKYGWLDNDVMLETLKRYSDVTTEIGAQATAAAREVTTFTKLMDTLKEGIGSGWGQTFEYIIGDYGEAKELWTNVSAYLNDIVGQMSDARNDSLKVWHDLGGRDALISALGNVVTGVTSVIQPIRTAWENVFGVFDANAVGQKLLNMTKSFQEFTSHMKLSDTASNNLRKTFQGLFDILKVGVDAFKLFLNVVKPVAAVLGAVLSAMLEGFLGVTGAIGSFTSTIINAIRESGFFQNIIKGITDLVSPLANHFKEFGEKAYRSFADMMGGADNAGAALANFVLHVGNTIKDSETFQKAVKGIKDALTNAVEGIDNFLFKSGNLQKAFDYIKDKVLGAKDALATFVKEAGGVEGIFSSLIDKLAKARDSVKNFISEMAGGKLDGSVSSFRDSISKFVGGLPSLSDALDKAKNTISGFFKSFSESGIGQSLKNIGSALGNFAKTVLEAIVKGFQNLNWDTLSNILETGILAAIGVGFARIVNGIAGVISGFKKDTGGITKSIKETIESFSEALESLKGVLEGWQSSIKADVILKIAQAVGILAASIFALSLLDTEKLNNGIIGMASAFTGLITTFKIVTASINAGDFANAGVAAGLMLGMATAILELSFAITRIGKLDMEEIAKGSIGIIVLMKALSGVKVAMSAGSGDVLKTIGALTGFALTVKQLAKVVEILGGIDFGQMAQGLTGLGVLLAELSTFLRFTDFEGLSASQGFALIEIATSINLITIAVKSLGNMDLGNAAQGVIALGVLLTEIGLFVSLTDSKMTAGTAASIGVLGASLAIFAADIAILGNMDISTLAKGLSALAVVLLELAIALNAMAGVKNAVSIGAGILILANAILVLTPAIFAIGSMPLETIAKGLIAIGIALAELVVGANLMNGTLAGSAAMVVMAAALNMLVPAIAIMGSLPWQVVALGLGSLAAVIVVLGVGTAILTPLIPLIISLSTALALLGAASAGFGIGVAAFSAGAAILVTTLITLSTVSATAAQNIVNTVQTIATGIATIVPNVASALAQAIVVFVSTLAAGAPQLAEAAVTLCQAVATGIAGGLPAIIEGVLQAVSGILNALIEHGPTILNQVIDLLLGILNVISERTPDIVNAAVQLGIALINGLANAIIENDDALFDALQNLVIAMGDFLMAALQSIVELIPGVGGKISDAIGSARDKWKENLNTTDAKETGSAYANAIAEGVQEATPNATEAGTGLAEGTKTSVLDGLNLLPTDTGNIFSGVPQSLQNIIPGMSAASQTIGQETHDNVVNPLQPLPEEVGGLMGSLGTNMTETLGGLRDTSGTTSQEIHDGIINPLTPIPEETNEIFGNMPNNISDVLSQMSGSASTGSQEVHDAFLDPMTMLPEELEQALDGCPAAISSMGPEMTSAADQVSSDTVSTFNSYTPEWTSDMEDKTNTYVSTMESGSSRASQQAQTWAENVVEKLKSKDGEWEKSATANTTNYTNAISNAQPKATQASTNFANAAFKPLSDKAPEWPKQGTTDSTAYSNSISAGAPAAESASKQLSDSAVKGLSSNTKQFESTGKESGDAYVGGIERSGKDAESAGRQLGEDALSGADSKTGEFEDIGEAMGDGLIRGLENRRGAVADKAADIVADAVDAALKEADIHSPSKKTEFVGEMMDEGLIVGFKGKQAKVSAEAASVIDASLLVLAASLAKVSDMVESELDTSPVITPVIDLSSVRSGIGSIDTMMTDVGVIDTDSVKLNIGKASAGMTLSKGSVDLDATGQNGSEHSVVNVEMNQNIYSPKAVDPFTVYRQTRNQLAQVRDAILNR